MPGNLLEMMAEIWDERFKEEDYIYGVAPNEFFKNVLERFSPTGTILLPGEGEGRNAVFAGSRGLQVHAFDISAEAKKKALNLAKATGTEIEYRLGDFLSMPYADESFDVAAIIFSHFHLSIRAKYHARIATLVRPGGLLILEGFSKNNHHLVLQSPTAFFRGTQACYTIAEIESDFSDFEILQLCEDEVKLTAGKGHRGLAKVIRFIGRKR